MRSLRTHRGASTERPDTWARAKTDRQGSRPGTTAAVPAVLREARASLPAHPLIRANLAAAHGLQGDIERARIELAEARKLSRDDRFASITHLIASQNFGVPEVRALFESTYVSGLRNAGLPEDWQLR